MHILPSFRVARNFTKSHPGLALGFSKKVETHAQYGKKNSVASWGIHQYNLAVLVKVMRLQGARHAHFY